MLSLSRSSISYPYITMSPSLDLATLLNSYTEIFQPPTSLRPPWPQDHRTTLLLGANPVNVWPYHYPHFQKVEFERLVSNTLKLGIIRPNSSPYSSIVLVVRRRMVLVAFVWITRLLMLSLLWIISNLNSWWAFSWTAQCLCILQVGFISRISPNSPQSPWYKKYRILNSRRPLWVYFDAIWSFKCSIYFSINHEFHFLSCCHAKLSLFFQWHPSL